ncbi:hypothetical protein ACFVZC_04725, partial [Streptomyces marokkonensis]
PLLLLCALVDLAVGLGVTGAGGEFTAPIVVALAMAAAPLARRFGVTVLASFAESLAPARLPWRRNPC